MRTLDLRVITSKLDLVTLNENARFTGYNKQVGPRNIK